MMRSRRVVVFVGAAFAVLALLAATIGPAGALPAGGSGAVGLERAIEVQDRNTDGLLARNGVIGTGVTADGAGHRIIVFTDRAGVGGLPASIDGVPTVVHAIGTVRALERGPCSGPPSRRPAECFAIDRTARFERPVPIGVSTGHPTITAGTIGARVTDGQGAVLALSNNHVWADENTASLGDALIQPGTFDGGTSPADDIGTLHAFEPIVFSTLANNVMDAAVATTDASSIGTSTPSDGYGTPATQPAAASLGLDVMKYGRTTGQTSGTIDAVNVTVTVTYDRGSARFVDQIAVVPGSFSAGGDSGSLVVTAATKQPVGLLFAGNNLATFMNPIQPILDRFGIAIDGSGTPPPTGNVSVDSMTPSAATAGSSQAAQLTGTGFVAGASVSFVNGSGPTPTASGVVVSAGTIDFTLTVPSGGPPRARTWDVRVTNPDGSSGTLAGALTVSR